MFILNFAHLVSTSSHSAEIPIFYFSSLEEAVEKAGESSRTTHGHILTVDACKYVAGLIVGAMMGHSKEQILSHRYCPVSGYWDAYELALD